MLPRPRRHAAPSGRRSHRSPRRSRWWHFPASWGRQLPGRALRLPAGQQARTAGQQARTAGQQARTAGKRARTAGKRARTAGARTPTAASRTRTAGSRTRLPGTQARLTGARPLTAGIAATAAAVGITAFAVAIHQPAGPKLPGRGGPPWSRPSDTAVGVHLAGLTTSRFTGEVTRYYLHLDVFVNGKHVPVPANLGVDRGTGEISALHTWDSSGIVQAESNAESPRYTLGQLFDIWQVPLSATQIGGLRSGRRASLSAYVNGEKVRGDPRRVTLAPQQEIAIEFGAGPFNPPASYQFPPAG